MARTPVTATVSDRDTAVTPTSTTMTTGAGNGVALDATNEVFLRIENGTAGAAAVTLLAGTGLQSTYSAAGDLEITVPAGEVRIIGPLESARFEAGDGTIIIESDAAVLLEAFHAP